MFSGNYRLALTRVRAAKWHSILTMFGIIVGIVSVVTTVSLSEGIKRQVVSQVSKTGNGLITVRPGNFITRDREGTITHVNPAQAYGFGSGSLSEADIQTINRVPGVADVVPLNLLNTGLTTDGGSYNDGFVLGTDAIFPSIMQQKVAYGEYFSDSEEGRHLAVIGKRVAEQLFQENIPIGQSFTIRGQEYIVRGVFDEFGPAPLGQGIDLNKAVFVPRPALKNLSGDAAPLAQILVRPKNKAAAAEVVTNLERALTKEHGGQQDFTVLRQEENVSVASDMLELLTRFVASIAAISLLVGGIGIMNIMLASISERTHEIGIRKAVGATNRQIRNQFMAEAVVLGLVGGVLGVIFSFVTNFIIRVSTNLHPVITWPIVLLAVGVSLAVGIIFGTIPAVKAARKDPIEALRVLA
jgi:ABC-type antimicrobial peptide transport system permease subunit